MSRANFKLTLPLAIILLAFGLRVLGLRPTDLGMDGGVSLAVAAEGPAAVLTYSERDVHPPLYYLSLSYWTRLAGERSVSAKFPSIFSSVLTVALLYALGSRLRHPRLGLLAAGLTSISPIQITNAEAVRDFVLAGLFATLSTYTFVGLLQARETDGDRRKRRDWIIFVLGSVGGLLTSYLNLGVLAAQVLFALTAGPVLAGAKRMARRDGSNLYSFCSWGWLALISIFQKLGGGQAPRPASENTASLWSFAGDALRHLSAGEFAAFDPRPGAALYLLVPLAGLGWLWYSRRSSQLVGARHASPLRRLTYAWFLLLALVVSLAMTYGIVQVWLHLPLPSRYLMVASPFFVLLVAMGLDVLADSGPVAPILALVALAGASMLGLRDYYSRPALPASFWDPVGLVTYLDANAGKGDGLIFVTPEQTGYYKSLSRRPLDSYYFFIGASYLEGNMSDNVRKVLPGAAAKHDALWLVYYLNGLSSSSQEIVGWLNRNAYLSKREALSDTTLLRYVVSQEQIVQRPVGASFGQMISLKDAGLSRTGAPGGDIVMSLTWQAMGKVDGDYTVFVHLLDGKAQGMAQFDSPPQNGEVPTSAWQPGEIYGDKRAIDLPSSLPTGEYWIELGLYRGEDRLDLVQGGSSVRLGPIEVRPAS